MTAAIDEILEWASSKLHLWQRDALRRIASSLDLIESDINELILLVKQEAGFPLPEPAVEASPLERKHLSSTSATGAIKIKCIRNIQNVNQLAPEAELSFKPSGLTVIYGANGSGKTGFIRILRSVCRSRITDPNKLKVLADVYGSGSGPLAADIVIETSNGEQTILWADDAAPSDKMLSAAVFDSKAAELYVDEGNQIRFLPFGLALPHKLNEVCVKLKGRLEAERNPIKSQLFATEINFAQLGQTKARTFYEKLSRHTNDTAIESAATFVSDQEARLTYLEKLLVGSSSEGADRRSLADWLSTYKGELLDLASLLADDTISELLRLRDERIGARRAADLAAHGAFAGEPLPGVGSETWRGLWEAARTYSTQAACPGQEFPVAEPTGEGADPRCVLCHQSLDGAARERFARFEAFVSGSLAKKAEEAEQLFVAGSAAVRDATTKPSKEAQTRLGQLEARIPHLAQRLRACVESFDARRLAILKLIAGEVDAAEIPTALTVPEGAVNDAAAHLRQEAAELVH